jgi:hypothetical protein
MQYVLGNMLNGGGINPDGLSLDLQFAADKTLTARRGPNPVFTRGSTGTFVGSDGLIQSAAVNEPRFDHTSAGVCRGLLIEEGRTNLAVYSDRFDDTSWVKTNSTITANASVAPDGTTTADKLRVNTTSGQHNVNRLSISASGATVTISVFAKAGELSWLALTDNQSFGSWFDLTNGVTGSNIGSITSKSITSFGNGWYRCAVSFTSNSSFSGLAAIATNANNVLNFVGANTTDGIFLWGAQVEAGSFPTSYIPTTTGTLARSADVCSITDSDFSRFWNQNEGTIFADSAHIASPFPTTVMANSGANSNQISIFRTTPSVCRFGVASGGSYSVVEDFSITSNQSVKMIGAYSSANSRAALNGNLSGLDTSVVVPTNLTRLNIGSGGLASSDFANGHIAAIRYFKKRLPDAKLQALTV